MKKMNKLGRQAWRVIHSMRSTDINIIGKVNDIPRHQLLKGIDNLLRIGDLVMLDGDYIETRDSEYSVKAKQAGYC